MAQEVSVQQRREAEDMMRLLEIINREKSSDWRAPAWVLSRRHPEDFGPDSEEAADDEDEWMQGPAQWQAAARELVERWPDHWGRRLRSQGPRPDEMELHRRAHS
jgi:hypothetical protein